MRKDSYRDAARQKRRFPGIFRVQPPLFCRFSISGMRKIPNTILSGIFRIKAKVITVV
jgi:hypothetical protein